ncbi:hypothetical protein CHL78_011285 [Romboutsia weinsteinii]|uniref:Nuclease-associated modular DNA-binding 1 domain-containing protein n=1 Tax=Romboutsia weinsteinii TaxID=2020949 RepID=A0A371J273_9FIRM|nr:hypothetical protein [Romboutsia weinsteinii]RDY26912.1 hypothetical protein CHL78_011285 [Romboutsia weinsteinii]
MFKRFFKRKKDKELENKVDENLTKESDTLEVDFDEVSLVREETVENIKDEDCIFEKVSFTKTNEDIENTSTSNNTIVLEDLTEGVLDVEEILEDILTNKVEDEEIEITEDIDTTEETEEEALSNNAIEEELYILDIKIKRGKGIKVRDLYTEEEQIFKTHKECSKKLKLPLGYIKENLKYGHTDYLGEAINFLTKELHTSLEDGVEFDEFAYLESSKTPMEQFSILNDKIFKARISESKRDLILSSIKIEPVKMHYTFECIDNEYNDYFEKYKSIILRGGKKKIELVSKNGEAIEIFKSIDECANYLNKDREEVVDMLKYGNTKAGRYEIRYSLRSI